MRTLSFVIILRNVRPLLCSLAILTAIALASDTLHATINKNKNIQEALGTTQATFLDHSLYDTGKVSEAGLVTTSAPVLGLQKPPLDFDGDNKTDYAVVRNPAGTLAWYIQRSNLGFFAQSFGINGIDTLVPGDYDGDLKWDIAVWRDGNPGTFYIFQSMTGTLRVVQFGQAGDDPRIT